VISELSAPVGELAGKHLKRVQLELGGKNAVIVLDDADLDAVASAIAFGAWFHEGTEIRKMTIGFIKSMVMPTNGFTWHIRSLGLHMSAVQPVQPTQEFSGFLH